MCRWTGLLSIATLVLAVGVAAQEETPDYGQYRVLDVQELDLHAAPANTAAHLSPDGTQFAHFGAGEVCFYQQQGNDWVEDRCFELDRDVFAGPPEDVNWSPDSRFLTAPTFRSALMFLEDTDIQMLDVNSGIVQNLTDDGVTGGMLSGGAKGNLDIAPVWLDDDTLRFIRFAAASPDAEGDLLFGGLLPGAIDQIDLPSGGVANSAEPVVGLPGDNGLQSYILAADPVSGRMAVNVDEMDDSPPTYAVWQAGPEGEPFEPFASLGALPIRHLAYSADGEWLMAIQPLVSRQTEAAIPLVSTVTGETVTLDLDSGGFAEPRLMTAGWSPTGDALAYVVRDDGNPAASGLYIAPSPGEPGHLILPGEFYGTTCCMGMSIRWAANDVIMIGRGAQPGVLLVQVGP